MANKRLVEWKKKHISQTKKTTYVNNKSGGQSTSSASQKSETPNPKLVEWKKKNVTQAEKPVTTNKKPTVKESYANAAGFNTLATDLEKTNELVVGIANGWQSPETMQQSKKAIEDMYGRLGAYVGYQLSNAVENTLKENGMNLYGAGVWRSDAIGQDNPAAELYNQYGKFLEEYDNRAAYYGHYQNADAYNEEQKNLNKVYTTPIEDMEKYGDAIAYKTSWGETIKWSDVYNEAKLRQYEQDITTNYDIDEHGKFVKQEDVYKEKPWYIQWANAIAGSNPDTAYMADTDFNNGKYIDNYNAHKYNFINGDAEAKQYESNENVEKLGYNDALRYEYFTDEEKKIFNTIWSQLGEEKAMEYVKLHDDVLRARRVAEEQKRYTAEAQESVGSAILSSIGTVGAKLVSSIPEALLLLTDYADDGNIDLNSVYYRGNRYVSTTRGAVEDMIDNGAGKFGYRLGTNIADNAAAMGVGALVGALLGGGAGKFTQSSIMASGSFTDTVLSAKQRGLTDEQAMGLGTIAAAVEIFFESKSFEALLGGKNLGKGWKGYVVDNLKTELKGELSTEIINDVADFIISQDMNQWATSIETYKKQGFGEKEALKKTITENALRYAEVAATSVISSGVFAGSNAASMQVSNVAAGQALKKSNQVNEVFELAKLAPESSQTYETLKYLESKGITAENISDSDLGNLYNVAVADAYGEASEKANKDKAKVEHVVGKQVDVVTSDKSDAQKAKATNKVDKVAGKYQDATKRIGQYSQMQTKLANIDGAVNGTSGNVGQGKAGASQSNSAPNTYTTHTPGTNAPKTELEAKEEAVTDAAYKAGRANVAMEQVAEILDTPEKVEAYERGRVDYIEQDLPKQVKKSAGTPIVERLDALTSDNETIYADEVKQATSFGDKGSQVIADIANTDGVTFSQAKKQTAAAYLAGFTDSDSSQFTTEAQKKAYAAGVEDRAAQISERISQAQSATVYEGSIEENEHFKVLSKEAKQMARTLVNDFGLSMQFTDQLMEIIFEGGKQRQVYANARHTDGKIDRSSDSDNVVHKDLIHEVLHRMMQVAPEETGVLLNHLYQSAVQNGRSTRRFDSVKAEYDNGGQSLNTLGVLEEIGAQELQELFANEKAFNKWRKKLESDAKLRNGWGKLIKFFTDLIDRLKRFISEIGMTADEKAKAQKLIDTLERYAEAYKASMKAVEQKSLQNGGEVKANEGYNVKTSLSKKAKFRALYDWHTGFTKAEVISLVESISKVGNPESKRITDTACWYKGRFGGNTYFAIYSTEYTTNQTILYASKGKQAEQELNALLNYLEEIENGEGFVGKSAYVNWVSVSGWMQQTNGVQNSNTSRRGASNQNAGVLQGQSQRIGSGALWNVVDDLLGKQGYVNINPKKVNHSLKTSFSTDGMTESEIENAHSVINNLKTRAKASKYVSGYASYTPERMERELKQSSSSDVIDYAKSYITWVDPIDFIYATTTRNQLKEEAGRLDIEKLQSETQPIHLTVNFETGEIVGHEGRHRMLALQGKGIDRVAIIIDALNDSRHHTKPIDFMSLIGQRFAEHRKGTDMFLHDMLPLSQRYADVARELFTNKPKSGVQYSLKAKDIEGKPIDPERISSNVLDVRYSLKHSKDIAQGQLDYLVKNKAHVSEDELKEAQRVTAAMVDVMMKYSSILPEDKIGEVLTKNGSYDRSVENTTICVRTLAYNEFVDKVQEEIGRPLTQMESFLVSQKLYDIATEPQCLYCYVSLDRKAFNDMLLRYMQDRDTVIAKYNKSDKTPEAVSKLYEEFRHGRKDTKEMKSRFDKWLGYVDNGTKLLSLADIATEERQSVIKSGRGVLAEQLADARKYAQSASWSKIQKNYVAYRDEILKMSSQVVKNLNEHYGLRWYSFSDYSAAFIVENMQQITDASIRGLKGLAYTKDTDFVEIFAPSGMNVNISVFVNQDADGNFYIDEKQSANFEKAKELRAKYPNVGIVATVTNDEAMKWAGEQEWSDVIIPFHIVRTGANVAEYYKWLNYTSESGDTIKDKDLWKAYVDSLNLKTENARKKVSKNIYPSEHKNDKTTYLTLCENRGLSPRFARFAGESWYMKLVNETRLSADESSVLKPIFNEEAAKASFQKFVDKGGYEGGWYKEGVNVDDEAKAVASDVLAGKKANEVDYGRQDNFNPEELIANRKGNRTHGTSLSLKKGSTTPSQETQKFLDLLEEAKNGDQSAANQLSKYVDSGLITTKLYDSLIKRYGIIPKGENPYRDIRVPAKTDEDKKVSQTVRTILEAKATPDEMLPTIEKMVEDGVFSYDVYTDKQAISDAENYLKEYGWTESLNDWLDDVRKGIVSKQHTTMGWALYNNAVNIAATTEEASTKREAMVVALDVLNAMVEHQRNAAQALQATRILKKLSPETQLYGVQKSVNALQKELSDKYGKKAPDLNIDEKLAEDFLKAKTEEEREAAIKEIYKDIGRQVPSTFMDKWTAWRYLAMLTNPRTHIKNILGNAIFAPVVITKDLTATAIESVVYRISGKKMGRNKALIVGNKTDRALLKAAWKDYANVKDSVSNGGKYNDSAIANKYIDEGRRIFGSKKPVVNKLLTPLEKTRKGNSNLLEIEDVWFSQPHYAYALAQYCKAHNITAEQIGRGMAIAPAREYAIKEAQKATYKDTNAFSQLVSQLGRNGTKKNAAHKALGVVVEGVLPFRKTPANILARGVEYSPIGLLKGLSYDLAKVSRGEMTASEAIDDISAGLTGTGLMALGMLLSALGVVRGHGEDDEKEKEFKEMTGHQAYSLELPNGTSVTLDWLAPEALPFFVGVNLWEATKGSKEDVNLSSMLNAVTNISEPMLEMSCLQGINDMVESVGGAYNNDTSGLVSVLASATTSYLTQGVPTFFGQVERTGETHRMTTYTEKDAFLTGDMQYTIGKVSAKTPGWDYNQIPYIDAWGRKEASGTALKRGFNNFLNPSYSSTIEESEMEKELLRLYEATGEDSVFPQRAKKYFTVDGKRKDLTADEYVRYATLKGEKSYKLITDLVKSSAYKKLDDDEKLKAIEEAYTYADQKAKQAISNYAPDKWVTTMDEAGAGASDYLAFRADVSDTRTDNGGKISKEEVTNIVTGMAQSDSEAWLMYLSMYDSKSAIEAEELGIDAKLYMTAVVELDNIYSDYRVNGKIVDGKNLTKEERAQAEAISNSRRKKVEKYLKSVCETDMEYWFLLGTEFESVKDDQIYLKHVGK